MIGEKKYITLNVTSNEVTYESLYPRGNQSKSIKLQRWRIGNPDAYGWRTIRHPLSGGLYLTVITTINIYNKTTNALTGLIIQST